MEEIFSNKAKPVESEVQVDPLTMKLGHIEERIGPAPILENCCNHQISGNRKFRLTFETGSLMDDCGKQAKSKCQSFWNFVDSDPVLSSLVKEGQFFHSSDPGQVPDKTNDKKSRSRKVEPDHKQHVGLTREEFQALYQEDRQRLQKRREANALLEFKSGQTAVARNLKAPDKQKPDILEYADACKESFTTLIQEINRFDEQI